MRRGQELQAVLQTTTNYKAKNKIMEQLDWIAKDVEGARAKEEKAYNEVMQMEE